MGERVAEITPKVTAGVLRQSLAFRQRLSDVYRLLPETRCRRRSLCCSLLPEMTLLEALTAVGRVAAMAPAVRMEVTRGFIRHFLMNPVEVSSCPFLVGNDCRIYQERFFGCRAYGLWSRPHYEGEAQRNRKAKEFSRKQWEHLGVRLPREVLEFQVPYCPHVEVAGAGMVEDALLLAAQERLDELSGRLGPWHKVFRTTYFADVSFFLASHAFGLREAVATKFCLVRDLMMGGDRERLIAILEEVPDVCARLV